MVLTSLWPSSSCTVLMSVPACSRCVAKEWRSVCAETCRSRPAAVTARLIPRCKRSSGPCGALEIGEPRQLDCEHFAVEKQQRAQRLVVRSRRRAAGWPASRGRLAPRPRPSRADAACRASGCRSGSNKRRPAPYASCSAGSEPARRRDRAAEVRGERCACGLCGRILTV